MSCWAKRMTFCLLLALAIFLIAVSFVSANEVNTLLGTLRGVHPAGPGRL